MNHFPYAKPPTFHYQTFNRHTLQFTNHPLFEQPPRPPTPVVVEPLEEEGAGPAKPVDSQGDAEDQPKEEVQDAETSTSAEVPETDAGLSFRMLTVAALS